MEHMGDPGLSPLPPSLSLSLSLSLFDTILHSPLPLSPPLLDFSAPFVPPQQQANQPASTAPGEDDIAMVMALGFSREQALKALKATVSTHTHTQSATLFTDISVG